MRVIILFWRFKEECNPTGKGKWGSLSCDFGQSQKTKIYQLNGKDFFEVSEGGENHRIYLIAHGKAPFGNEEKNCVIKKIKSIIQENKNDEILIFCHFPLKCEFILKHPKVICWDIEPPGEVYGNKGLINVPKECLEKNYKNNLNKIWKTYYKKNPIDECIKSFLLIFVPLHLSLQAFWGVAVKEVPEDLSKPIEFVKIGTRNGNKYLSQINEQREKLVPDDVTNEIKKEYREIFPNSDSFLLVKEAEYDFYAPLIDLVVNGEKGIADENKDENKPNCDEERDMYEMPTLKEVIEEVENRRYGDNNFFASLKSVLQNTNANSCKPTIKNGSWTYNAKEFISCLREICAILANTCEKCQKDRKYFGYKGKNKKQNRERKDKGINNILSSLGKNFKEPHCKLEEFEGRDKVLIKQLTDWGIEKALVVIAGIEVLGRELSNLLV